MSSSPRRTGSADLPLHGGKAPPWLFERMSRLAPEVIEALVLEHGVTAVLERLADPYWFQAFGCLLGFDWHSSGVTTTVCGALKVGLAQRGAELGICVAGGKGGTSRNAPQEIAAHADGFGLDAIPLVHASRMSAKVDSAAVQDGFQIYHHAFFLTSTGAWAVVQQGMHEADGYARRYHWLGERVSDFVCEPHAAICSDRTEEGVLNLTALEGAGSRRASVELAREEPERVLVEAKRLSEALASSTRALPLFNGETTLDALDAAADDGSHTDLGSPSGRAARGYRMPRRHWVDPARDVLPRNLPRVLLSTWEAAPRDFAALLALPGVGAKSLRALALLSEVVYGTPASFRDPARFSFAHGGKDGHPFPVDRETYDRSIDWLRNAVSRARIGHSDRLRALQRLKDYDGRPAARELTPPAPRRSSRAGTG
jgi:hypothetical protein